MNYILKSVYRCSKNNLIYISFKDILSNIIDLNFIGYSLSDIFESLGVFKPKSIVGPARISPIIFLILS